MRNIAIACQGGGSHTAFTAGVLQTILEDSVERGGYRISGLSGTSGGAVCALLAWYSLLRGDSAAGIRSLGDFWLMPYPYGNAAMLPPDYLINQWLVHTSSWPVRYETSPYALLGWTGALPGWAGEWASLWVDGQTALRHLLNRFVDFAAIPDLLQARSARPELFIGAVEITRGDFVRFSGEHPDFSVDAVIASATLPEIMRTLEIADGGYQGAYWDGLFSENPPVSAFCDRDEGSAVHKPDEIWVIRINPRTRAAVPQSLHDIYDRRNELAGNLSLEHGLYMIDKINRMVGPWRKPEDEADAACPNHLRKYKIIETPQIAMDPAVSGSLDYPSKFDRSPTHLTRLLEHGREQGRAFLDTWHAARSGA